MNESFRLREDSFVIGGNGFPYIQKATGMNLDNTSFPIYIRLSRVNSDRMSKEFLE